MKDVQVLHMNGGKCVKSTLEIKIKSLTNLTDSFRNHMLIKNTLFGLQHCTKFYKNEKGKYNLTKGKAGRRRDF